MTESTSHVMNIIPVCYDFLQARAWSVLPDERIFAVQGPGDQTSLYCVVLGYNGERQGLALFPGPEGLRMYKAFQAACGRSQDWMFFPAVRVITVTFEGRSPIPEEDADFLRRCGWDTQSGQVWPMFRSLAPGYRPRLPSLEECCWLEWGLKGTLVLLRALAQEQVDWEPEETLPVVQAEEREGHWHVRMQAFPAEAAPAVPGVDEVRLQRIKKGAVRKGIWEGLCFWLRMTVQEQGEWPFYPIVAVWVDKETGMILHHEMDRPAQGTGVLQRALIEAMEASGTIPELVLANTSTAVEHLRPVTRPLHIQISRADRLEAAEAAVEWLQSYMVREVHEQAEDPVEDREHDLVAQVEQANHELLALFEAWLADQGLGQATRVRHLRTLDVYLNSFLLDIGPMAPDEGMFKAEEFFCNWLPKAFPWSSPSTVQGMVPGLKKFAVCLHEQGLMGREDLEEFLALIKAQRKFWERAGTSS